MNLPFDLGPFGFLHYDDGFETIGGNQGMEDQRLALSWVKENIGKFGGNKSMVCLTYCLRKDCLYLKQTLICIQSP